MNIRTLAKLVPLLALVAALSAFAACGDEDDNDGSGTTPVAGDATDTPAAESPAATTAATTPTAATDEETVPIVAVGDNFFQPASLTVSAGDTVRWVWSGSVPHSVRLDDETSPTHTGSGEFEFTFNEPGTYDYVCGVHGESMPGRIIVE